MMMMNTYRVGQKLHTKLMATILSNLNTDLHNSFTGKFTNKFAVTWFAYVATLPYETLMPENGRLTINYKVV